jgi:RNA polymerase sigma factor (sigma-70 family)
MVSTDVNLLQLLADKHIDWLKMVQSFGGKGEYAVPNETVEDIVQNMYLKLHKYVKDPERVMYGAEINTMFVYTTLKNMYIDYVKKDTIHWKRTVRDTGMLEQWEVEIFDKERAYKTHRLDDMIKAEVENWHYYESKLFKLIYYEHMGMRQLSRETGISLSSIFNTCKTCRLRLKDKFELDYNDILD